MLFNDWFTCWQLLLSPAFFSFWSECKIQHCFCPSGLTCRATHWSLTSSRREGFSECTLQTWAPWQCWAVFCYLTVRNETCSGEIQSIFCYIIQQLQMTLRHVELVLQCVSPRLRLTSKWTWAVSIWLSCFHRMLICYYTFMSSIFFWLAFVYIQHLHKWYPLL